MRRRGFLGFLAGGAVAGPSLAKQAVASTLLDLNVAGIVGSVPMPDYGGGPVSGGQVGSSHEWEIGRLAKLMTRTASQHAFHKRQLRVQTLDPDIAGYRSFSLAQKVRMQLDRDYERSLHHERGYLEAAIAGWFE